MHGAPALPAGFSHMPYANPDAPKGGRLVQGLLGTFDSLNPMIVRGLAVQQIRGFVVESLMTRGNDEPFTLYGLLAKSIETDDAEVICHLPSQSQGAVLRRPAGAGRGRAVFVGPCCAKKAVPIIGCIYTKVAKAEALDDRTVRFDFGGAGDRELPLILGLMPVMPKHAIDVATFEETSMTAPLGSGALPRHRGQARRQRDADAQSRLLGPRSADQPRACGISTRSGSISTARPTASSKRSSAGFMISASRPSRCAGTTATTFRRRAMAR